MARCHTPHPAPADQSGFAACVCFHAVLAVILAFAALLGILALLVVALGSFAAAAQERAQDWPTRPVRVIVPYGPGGIGDLLVRLTTDRLAKMFGQPFVLENRPGGGGVVGLEYAAHAANDGYTLAQAGGSQFSVVPLMQKLNYDPVRDLTPIGIIAVNGMALAVRADLPVRSVAEFIAYAKANPGKLNYGTGDVGTSSHLVPAAFAAPAPASISSRSHIRARLRPFSRSLPARCRSFSATSLTSLKASAADT